MSIFSVLGQGIAGNWSIYDKDGAAAVPFDTFFALTRKDEGKVTYVDLKGLDGCAQEVEKCTLAAKEAIRDIPDHEFLWELADRMVGRSK